MLVKSSPLMQQRPGETEACPRCFTSPLRRPISSDLCYFESLPETLASFLPSQARQAGYREYNTTHWVPLPNSCSPGEAQARGDRGFSEPQTLGSGLPSLCAGREDARAERRNQWHSHHPPASDQVTRVWLSQRQMQFMSRVLARAQWCHPDTCTSCRPNLPRLRVSQGRSRCLWGRCRDPRGQGHTSHLRPELSYRNGDFVNFFLLI